MTFLSTQGMIHGAHSLSVIQSEILRANESGDLTPDLLQAALNRAFDLGEVALRRKIARARRAEGYPAVTS